MQDRSDARRYEVVLDGIPVSDEESQELERRIQEVVRDFVESRQRATSDLAEADFSFIDDVSKLRERLTRFPNGHTAGIWVVPERFELER